MSSIQPVAEFGASITAEVSKAIVGKAVVIEKVLAAFLADGHVLLEDLPGLGKTLLANSLATVLGASFKRIQFTPDLLPGDITGGYVFDRNENAFVLRKGPVFANIVLADEINRAAPKTQSSLLEAMQEKQVTLETETYALPKPFLVIATQNPVEYEGTFPLPEAQLDRFLLKLSVGYPSLAQEVAILHSRITRQKDAFSLTQLSSVADFTALQALIETVHIDPDLERYIVDLVAATRADRRVLVGASPRGSLALLKLSRAYAALNNRDYVVPDDIKHFAVEALSHRLVLEPDFWMRKNAAETVVAEVVKTVPVPVLKQ